jgi:hypothetical protein
VKLSNSFMPNFRVLKPASAILLCSTVALLAACGTVRAPSTGVSPYHLSESPGPPPAVSPPGLDLHRDPWLAYITDVNPGSAVQFVTPRVGWQLAGQGPSNLLDKHLSTGPGAVAVDWPGSSVSRSTDAGKTWKTVLVSNDGIWGIDALSADTSWVVGVTALARTTDGGAQWQVEGEPTGHPLVSADFVTALVGFGLTTAGQLMKTVNGGATWAATSLSGPGGALCFTSQSTGYVSDQDGSMYRTTDWGSTWSRVHATPFTSTQIAYTPLWSSLACNTTGIWQGLMAVTPVPPPGHSPYVVYSSQNAGLSWSAVAADLDGAVGLTLPSAPTSVSLFGGLSTAGSGKAFVIGSPAAGWALNIAGLAGSRTAVSGVRASVRPLASAGTNAAQDAAGYLAVHGLTFVGSQGWALYDDSALGSNSTPRSETILLHTVDGGVTWTVEVISNKHTY